MTGKLIHITPPEHRCEYPGRILFNGYVPNLNVGPGSIWQCDDCGQRWELFQGRGWEPQGQIRYHNDLGQAIGYDPERYPDEAFERYL
jgi:hypothetical protein